MAQPVAVPPPVFIIREKSNRHDDNYDDEDDNKFNDGQENRNSHEINKLSRDFEDAFSQALASEQNKAELEDEGPTENVPQYGPDYGDAYGERPRYDDSRQRPPPGYDYGPERHPRPIYQHRVDAAVPPPPQYDTDRRPEYEKENQGGSEAIPPPSQYEMNRRPKYENQGVPETIHPPSHTDVESHGNENHHDVKIYKKYEKQDQSSPQSSPPPQHHVIKEDHAGHSTAPLVQGEHGASQKHVYKHGQHRGPANDRHASHHVERPQNISNKPGVVERKIHKVIHRISSSLYKKYKSRDKHRHHGTKVEDRKILGSTHGKNGHKYRTEDTASGKHFKEIKNVKQTSTRTDNIHKSFDLALKAIYKTLAAKQGFHIVAPHHRHHQDHHRQHDLLSLRVQPRHKQQQQQQKQSPRHDQEQHHLPRHDKKRRFRLTRTKKIKQRSAHPGIRESKHSKMHH